MKIIKDEDLLFFHRQIEEAEIRQKKLEDVLKVTSEKLKRVSTSKKLLHLFFFVLLISTLFLLVYFISSTRSVVDNNMNPQEFSAILTEVDSLKNINDSLKRTNINIEEIKDLYLYRSLIRNKTVYSVQLKAFVDNKVASISEKFTNTLTYNDTSYYKLSLGIFETLSEAQEFRKVLINSGVNDKIFVVSYKNGKRLRIENAR